MAENKFFDTSQPPSRSTLQVAPLGKNKPLRIEIKDIFTGNHRAGEVLLTTAVKSAATFDARPLAVQATHSLKPGESTHLPFRANQSGSPIVYYTSASLDRELLVDVRLDFDSFDRDRFDRWANLIAKAGSLPVFVGASALGGPGGGAAAAAAVYAVNRGVQVAFRSFDRWKDGSNPADMSCSFSINLDVVGEKQSEAGYVLCWHDGHDLVMPPSSFDWQDRIRVAGPGGEEFVVSEEGELLYRESGRRVDDTDRAWVLLHVSGEEDDQLEDFEPTAASAALLAKFIGTEGDLIGDLAELAEAYNDFVFLNRIHDIDKKLGRAEGDKKTNLEEEREANVKHIRSDAVLELLKVDSQS